MNGFVSAERAWLAAPETADARCRNCTHHGEDHDDGRCVVREFVQRWDGTTPRGKRVRCDCPGFEPRTREDDEAEAADAAWDDYKERI